MTATTDTVHDRIERTWIRFTPTQVALTLAFVAALGFALLFVQEPMVHESLHDFRHAAGIVCH